MIFKDINCGFFQEKRPMLYACTFEEIKKAAKDNNIVAAALYNFDRSNMSVREANESAVKRSLELGGSSVPAIRLLPPAYEQESYSEPELRRLIDEHNAVFRINPGQDACPLSEWMFGWMFEVLEQTRTPLLVSLQELDLREAAAVKEKHPELRLVITNTTQWMNRQYMRFAQHYEHVYFDTSNIIEYFGIENIVGMLGAKRVLFGTYMPEKEPYDKIFQLMYCELSQEQKELIAFRNYERLVEDRAI